MKNLGQHNGTSIEDTTKVLTLFLGPDLRTIGLKTNCMAAQVNDTFLAKYKNKIRKGLA